MSASAASRHKCRHGPLWRLNQKSCVQNGQGGCCTNSLVSRTDLFKDGYSNGLYTWMCPWLFISTFFSGQANSARRLRLLPVGLRRRHALEAFHAATDVFSARLPTSNTRTYMVENSSVGSDPVPCAIRRVFSQNCIYSPPLPTTTSERISRTLVLNNKVDAV